MKFFQIIISISIDLLAGCIPVAGYNVGAGRNDRARDLFGLILKWQFTAGLVSFLIVELFPHQLIALFGAANESAYYTSFAVKSFRTYLVFLPVATINKGTFIYLQALGKAKETTVLLKLYSVRIRIVTAAFLRIKRCSLQHALRRRINICDRCCIDHKDNASVVR